jgi:prevent-host-death family protein
MARTISQRELRNQSGEIMRGLERGESFVVTSAGTPIGDLTPVRRARVVRRDAVAAAFASAPAIDPARFRDDVDAAIDQDPAPRA